MDTNVNILQLLEKLKKTIIEPQKKLWDEMEDETGMNKIEESNVTHMSIYRYKQEELMKKFIEKFLVDNNYYDLYRIAKVFVKFPKSYIERNLGVSLTDIKYEEFKQDLSDLVRLGDEALQEDASAVANGGGASAQLGTAPTPSLGQVTVNGKPWTSGKSYKAKKKKKIKEAYYIPNRVVKNQLTKLLYEVAPSMEIDDRIIEWLDKLGFKSVKSDEGFAYAKESDGYEHIIIYNKYNNIRLIRYYLHDDNDILFDKELELYSPEDVDALFKIIEIEI